MEKDTKVKKADKYENHIELRFHNAKKAIIPQLDAIIKVNLSLSDLCDELCVEHEVSPTTFKRWVNDQIPSILHVESDDIDDDDDDDEIGE